MVVKPQGRLVRQPAVARFMIALAELSQTYELYLDHDNLRDRDGEIVATDIRFGPTPFAPWGTYKFKEAK